MTWPPPVRADLQTDLALLATPTLARISGVSAWLLLRRVGRSLRRRRFVPRQRGDFSRLDDGLLRDIGLRRERDFPGWSDSYWQV